MTAGRSQKQASDRWRRNTTVALVDGPAPGLSGRRQPFALATPTPSPPHVRARPHDGRPLQGFGPHTSGVRRMGLAIVERRGHSPAARGTGPAGALATEEPPDHDQANPALLEPRRGARWRRACLQHAGRDRHPDGHHPVDGPGLGPGRFGRPAFGGAERLAGRLLVTPTETPRSSDLGRFVLSGTRRRAAIGRGWNRCNARAIRRTAIRECLQRTTTDAAARLRRRREETLRDNAAIGDHGRAGIRPGTVVRQCGAGRDDDVGSAASVCPASDARARTTLLAGAKPTPQARMTGGCNEDGPGRCRSVRLAAR